MRKSSLILSCGLVVALAGVAAAQDSALWFDIRNGTGAAGTIQNILSPRSPFTNGQEFAPATPAFNGGARGDGQKLWLEPDHNNAAGPYNENTAPLAYPNLDADGDRKTGDAYLYLDMFDVAGAGDVYAALGLNLDATQVAAGTSHRIGTIDFSIANDGTLGAGAPNPPWNNRVNGGIVAGDPPDWSGAKAVRVPVTSGPVYAAALGIQPGGPYRVAKLRVTAGARNCNFTAGHNVRSRVSVKMSANNLLIARVFSSGGDTDEQVSYGYNGAALDAPVSGNSAGVVSATDDLVIEIRCKGDGSGNNTVDAGDVGTLNAARTASGAGTLKQAQCFLFDANSNFTVDAGDVGLFNTARTGSTTCP